MSTAICGLQCMFIYPNCSYEYVSSSTKQRSHIVPYLSSILYWFHYSISPHTYIHKSHTYIHIFVNFDALAQESNFQIERRQDVFLCWIQDLNQGLWNRISSKLNAHWQTDWAVGDQAKTWTEQPIYMISEHSAHSTLLRTKTRCFIHGCTQNSSNWKFDFLRISRQRSEFQLLDP